MLKNFNPLKFAGIVIYVNEKNIVKYEKNILKYLKSDIIGFDTEFVIDINNSNKKFLNVFEKKNILINNISQKYALNGGVKTPNKLLEKKNENNLIVPNKYKKKLNILNIFKKKKNDNVYKENKTLCLIQLSSSDICFVFNINKLKGKIPSSIKEILEDDKIIKVCHDINNDKDMFLSDNIEIKNVFDLYNYSIENFIYPPSLQNLVKIYLKKFLDKNFRLSNWLSNHLTEEQILYAAHDAYASREIYMILKSQNKVNESNFFHINIKNYSVDSKNKKSDSTSINENINNVKSNDEKVNENVINREFYDILEKNENKSTLIESGDRKSDKIEIKELILDGNNYNDKKGELKKNYEYMEKNKLYIINNLKSEINMKCSKMNNIIFFEEMSSHNNSYKNVLYLKHMEKDNYFIKTYSFNYDDEIKCCKEILNYIDNKMF